MNRLITILAVALCAFVRAASLPVSFHSTTHLITAPLDLWTVNSAEIYAGIGLSSMSLQPSNNVAITGGSITGVAGLAYTATPLSQFAATTSSQLAGVISDETGSGALVFGTSPSLTTPSLGVATATSVNGTTIPTSKTLVVTTDKLSVHAATTSAELAGVLSDETGTGAAVFAASPTLVTPALGVATATSVNGTTIPTSKTLVVTTDKLSVHAATTSAELAGVLSDETGTGAAMFAASPTTTGTLTANIITQTGTTATDQPTLSAEFLGAGGWTSTDWTGSWAAGWTHTPGTTTALTQSTPAATTKYQITYTVTGRTAGTFSIDFGGESLTGISATGSWGPTTSTTASLSITPTSTFDGTIVISIKSITAPSSSVATIKSADGTVRSERRSNTGGLNEFVGFGAGRYVTSAINNTGIGYGAIYNATTGGNNTAVGGGALQFTTTGSFNTTIGTYASYAATKANDNASLGYVALYDNLTGDRNVAIGSQAGRKTSTGTSMTAPDNSVFIGYNAKGNADAEANQIVIGSNAVGAGSNTATIGSTSITKTVLRGAVNIGTGPAIITGPAANTLQIGDLDTAAPSAQTVKFQNVIAGTSNTAGPNATIKAPASSGNAAGGSLKFQTTPPGSSGTAQNTWVDAFTLAGDANVTATFGGVVRLKGYTVATLPAAGTAGRIAYVTDATAPTYRGALTGGGAVTCLVFDNGTSWESH